MSLPGLELTQPSVERQQAPAPPTQIGLSKGSEWRFEVAFGSAVRVKLLAGTAELFGTELAASQTYTFSGTKGAIFTWHGCTLEVSAGDTPPSLDGFAPTTATTTNAANGAAGAASVAAAAGRGLGAGGCQSEYTAEETPMVEYANVHFALETMRQEAKATGAKDGPRVLILGPENAGKTSLAKILTAYSTKVGRQPIVVNLDPGEGMLSVPPGTLTATAFRTMIDIEEGWGNSPMSGPSPVPVKLPLVYFYPMQSPLEVEGSVYRPIVSRLALSVTGRMAEDEDTRETGIIVDTPGILGQGNAGTIEMINHIVTEFSISTILVIGSERLYSTMVRSYDSKPTSSASAAASDERISVIKLSKSGGCVDRDAAFMKSIRESQIRSYFFGNPIPSTASSALSLSATSLTNVTLSPHASQMDFDSLAIYGYSSSSSTAAPAAGGGSGGQSVFSSSSDDDDDYDPAQLGTADSFLPGGVNDNITATTTTITSHQDSDPSFSSSTSTLPGTGTPIPPPQIPTIPTTTPTPSKSPSSSSPLKKLTSPPPSTLPNSLLAITHAPPTASYPEIRDASTMGFLYVADVDAEKGKIRVLAPVGGRVPARAIVWGRKWPGQVVGLVG